MSAAKPAKCTMWPMQGRQERKRGHRMAERTVSTTRNAANDQKLRTSHLFTSESVTEGHPDKIADQISDAILDAAIADDPMSRVACETLVTTGLVIVAGEMTTETYVDIPNLVREKIAQGVDRALEARERDDLEEIGAGDQGMMFGYACEETAELMPLPITLAHGLTRRLSEVRKNGELPYLRPDGKSQVTVRYEGDSPVGVEKILVSAQHREGAERQIRDDIIEAVIRPVMPEELFDEGTAEILVNPTGRFVIGGPQGDTG